MPVSFALPPAAKRRRRRRRAPAAASPPVPVPARPTAADADPTAELLPPPPRGEPATCARALFAEWRLTRDVLLTAPTRGTPPACPLEGQMRDQAVAKRERSQGALIAAAPLLDGTAALPSFAIYLYENWMRLGTSDGQTQTPRRPYDRSARWLLRLLDVGVWPAALGAMVPAAAHRGKVIVDVFDYRPRGIKQKPPPQPPQPPGALPPLPPPQPVVLKRHRLLLSCVDDVADAMALAREAASGPVSDELLVDVERVMAMKLHPAGDLRLNPSPAVFQLRALAGLNDPGKQMARVRRRHLYRALEPCAGDHMAMAIIGPYVPPLPPRSAPILPVL